MSTPHTSDPTRDVVDQLLAALDVLCFQCQETLAFYGIEAGVILLSCHCCAKTRSVADWQCLWQEEHDA